MAMSDAEPNTKYAPVPMPVPRDPEAYRAGLHFAQRLKDRVPDALQDRVIRECITRGYVQGTSETENIEDEEAMVQAFKFTREVEGTDWSVVVGILRKAYLKESAKHKVLTVYAEGDQR